MNTQFVVACQSHSAAFNLIGKTGVFIERLPTFHNQRGEKNIGTRKNIMCTNQIKINVLFHENTNKTRKKTSTETSANNHFHNNQRNE